MLYELTTLSCPLLSLQAAVAGAFAWAAAPVARGQLMGCWRTDIGTLGRVFVLRAFETTNELTAERHRALLDHNPFNAGGVVTALSMESYAPFPFLPPVRPGARGSVYEFRSYRLKPGGPPADAGWMGTGHRAGAGVHGAFGGQHVCARRTAPASPTSGASPTWGNARRCEPGPMGQGCGRRRAARNRSSKRHRRSPCRNQAPPLH